jgi:DNA-directed RNA polymerase subunit K/omega
LASSSTDSRLAAGPFQNRFLVVSVACRRVIQLQGGSRLRVDGAGHKPCLVAVAEVMAGTVPYFVA